MLLSNKIVLDISIERSSLISKLDYWPDQLMLVVYFRHQKPKYRTYGEVYPDHFYEMVKTKSIGKFYLQFIKPNFKQINYTDMAKERPKTKNLASNERRYIKMKINVMNINKDWLFPGEKGAYMDATLVMLPDGEVDKYGNLGFIVQDVPTEIYEKEKNLPKPQRTKGEILGNGAELDWGSSSPQPGETSGTPGLQSDILDDLPF